MPHGAKIIKAVMKDVVSDVLFYAESSHRERILASVAQQINTARSQHSAPSTFRIHDDELGKLISKAVNDFM